jgi:signal transduction histidine kinase
VTDVDPAGLRRRAGRLQQRLGLRQVDDPVLHAALSELTAIADRLSIDAGRLHAAEEALTSERHHLAAERSRSQLLFDVAPEAWLVSDANGIIRQANPAAAKLLNDVAVGRPLVLRFVPDDRARIHALAAASSRGKATDALIVTLSAGSPPVRAQLKCALAGEDHLLWIVRDVTEQQAAQARLEAAIERERVNADQLRELDEVRNAFVVAVSHDLQAPLAAIAGLAGLLVQQARLPAKDRRRMLEQIHSTAARLLGELHDLLDVERLQRGEVGLERRRVDIASLLETAVQAVDFGGRQLVVDTEPTTADADPVIIRRIIDNLLSNATRHTPPGTTVWARVRREPDGVLLVVEDDGPGVPDDLRNRVFELFSRDPRGTDSGLGIGLTLVRRFAALHGGSARLETRPGGGASFHVLFLD